MVVGRGGARFGVVSRVHLAMIVRPCDRLFVDVRLPGHARGRRAQHGRRHHAPNRKRDGQQHQQQDANDSHGAQGSRTVRPA